MADPIWQFSLQTVHALLWGGMLVVALLLSVRWVTLPKLICATTLLTFMLVALGAYVRLADAGLGCPDWPGCYGKLSPFHADAEIAQAQELSPAGPVTAPKAWKEMLHRYLASLVGALIVAIVLKVLYLRRKARTQTSVPRHKLGLPLLLLGVVVLQGLFGKWTVTLQLMPAVVTLHLLGGMVILGLLTWLSARHLPLPGAHRMEQARRLRSWALLGLLLVMLQIALGGWVSANYAALACIDFPTCHGQWLPAMNFTEGFHLQRDLGMTAGGLPLSNDALNAIHWSHRAGALVLCVYLGILIYLLSRVHGLRRYGLAVAAALILQVSLGITNVLAMLPLGVAVAHNAGAALLLMSVVVLNFALYQGPAR